MTDMDKPAWPDKKKSIFSLSSTGLYSPTWCSLGWLSMVSNDFGFLSGEFKRAADCIIQYISTGSRLGHPDGLFMPIACLFRHSLELLLKHLIRLALDLDLVEDSAKLEQELFKTHDLIKLWSCINSTIKREWPDEDETAINNAQTFIQSFHQLDKSGQNLRYTHDQKGASITYKYPSSIELKELQESYGGVYNFLTAYKSVLEDMINARNEMIDSGIDEW